MISKTDDRPWRPDEASCDLSTLDRDPASPIRLGFFGDWNEASVKVLVIVHRMAAKLLGFEELYA